MMSKNKIGYCITLVKERCNQCFLNVSHDLPLC
jgi:hypothetical protein